jgi:hypothetical protein
MRPDSLKVTVACAVAWRVAAELLRRHPMADLRVWQMHPGISLRGAIGISLGPPSPELRAAAVVINIGGPAGECEIRRPGAGVEPLGNLVEQFLSRDPRDVVDEIERRLALPSVDRLPASTAPALVARLIAGFLESRSFGPGYFRTTFGYADSAAVGPLLAAWVPTTSAKPEPEGTHSPPAADDRAATCRRLGRFVLLHECSAEGECAFDFSDLRSAAVMFDLSSADAVPIRDGRMEGRRRLLEDYADNGRRLGPLLAWLDGVVGATSGTSAPAMEHLP